MNRKAVWSIGIFGSFLLVLGHIIWTHSSDHTLQSYFLDVAERMGRPTALSFLAVCLIGLAYEVLLKKDDERGLENLVTRSVRAAFYGHPDPVHVVPTLTDHQNAIKHQLVECAKDLHKRRLNRFEREQVLEIHEFAKVWEVLINNTFEGGETLYDFTIGTNAMLRFQAYQFSRYYSDLFERRGNKRSSLSKIRILILCDYDNAAVGTERMQTASRLLESAVKSVLENIQNANRMNEYLSPREVYRQASNDGNAAYQFRLVSSKHIAGSDKTAFETPFNIYGNLAISQSFVAAANQREHQPIPHLAISFKAEDIDAFQRHFGSVWDRASFSITQFSETMTSWDDFGSGQLLKKWAEIGD